MLSKMRKYFGKRKFGQRKENSNKKYKVRSLYFELRRTKGGGGDEFKENSK